MYLSIVIPAFEESEKIAGDIEAASQFLAANDFTGEIIVIDDGSTDATAETAQNAGQNLPPTISLQVISLGEHRGKGCAVRTGILKSSGKYVMFADSGCCVPYGNALLGLELLTAGNCHIAHGSRRLIESDIQRDQPWHRRVCAKLFKRIMNTMLSIPKGLSDTQCGFKLYQGDVARKLYSKAVCDGFMFDVEIILLAVKYHFRIEEFAIEWVCDLDSRLSITRTPWPVLAELWRIKRRHTKE